MKLLDCEFTFDSAKVLFYFSAENLIDRDSVKDLPSIFRIRIELRQVGFHDETKVLGALDLVADHFAVLLFYQILSHYL